MHCVLVTCLLLISDHPGHLRRNIDTKPTVTLSMTIVVKFALKSSGISRHPRRVYSESCAFDYASVTFKESDDQVTLLTGRGPRCECFCRVVPRKGQRLKDLEHFLAVMRARYPNLQVRSDNEEALKHVLKDGVRKKFTWNTVIHVWKLRHPMDEVKTVSGP